MAAIILLERRKQSIICDLHRLQCSEILNFLFDDVIADKPRTRLIFKLFMLQLPLQC